MTTLEKRILPLAMFIALCVTLLLAAVSPLSSGSTVETLSFKQLHARDFNLVDRSLVVETANITTRDISPEDFEAARARGCGRLNWMRTGTGGPATPWFQFASLAENGWDFVYQKGGYPVDENPPAETTPSDLFDAYNALGYSTAVRDNPQFVALHNPKGQYLMALSPSNGAIVAIFNESPGASGATLYAQSDVYWLIWQNYVQSTPGMQAGLQLSNIKTFFRHHIVTQATTDVIDKVLENEGKTLQLGGWPGILIDSSSRPDSLQALLGTAHATMPVYFLAQHRAALGAKTITSVNIFTTGSDINLAYNVGSA